MGDELSPVKRALVEIRTLRAELEAAEQRARSPLAIVGMALRLPGGVHDAASFERLLFSGEDPLCDIPEDRWSLQAFYAEDPDAPGKMTTRRGGFVEEVDRFDADFFGISAREAASMDPQQRLLLELGWQAMEDAGVAPDQLRGTRTGVYTALGNYDYGRAIYTRRDEIDPYFATGTLLSVAAGRLSYAFGLSGPAMTVDTACSGSLVALHLACQALRSGECDAALAGGANLILTPDLNITFTKGRMMSPSGRCRVFDADADGYVRGEGGVMFLLKRLTDAQASGDRILAIVRGSAVNQDGRSSGLTAPNGPAQEAVIRSALTNAGVTPGEVAFVETHGTGTPLGDPIELGALASVFAPGRAGNAPLLVGAVKSVIGHTEAAAGAAGVAKCLIAFARGEIAPNLHFHRPTAYIDWEASRLRVAAAPTAFPEGGSGQRVAGVSAFGISGTNAHVVLEAPPAPSAPASTAERPLHLLALSARTDAALEAVAASWRNAFATQADAVADVCHTANAGRAHFGRRLAIVARTSGEFEAALASPHRALRGAADGMQRPQIAFLYTGQGANYPCMGSDLYAGSPTFRAALERCAAAAAPHVKRDLVELLLGGDAGVLEDTALAQPATFALQVALTELWRSWGVEPVAALGHSLGEYAAAWAAGLLGTEEAMTLVAARGRAAALVEGRGAMAVVFAPASEVAALLAAHADVEIAAYNGPEHVVVSGSPAAIDAVVERFEAAGKRAKLLKIPYGSHSRWVEPALPALAAALQSVTFGESRITLGSNVSGRIAGPQEMSTPAYWLEQMRRPVHFGSALASLHAQGVTHCVEIGPHPSLTAIGQENMGDAMAWLPSMRRDGEPWRELMESVGRLYVDGAAIDWTSFDRDYPRRRVAGPTYPFQRKRHWIDAAQSQSTSAAAAWARAAAAADVQAEQGPLGLDPATYPKKWSMLARLGNAHAASFLRGAGVFRRAECRSLEDIVSAAGVAAGYVDVVRRWCDRLVDSGDLERDGDAYRSAGLAEPDLDALAVEAERMFADNPHLLAYVRHCTHLMPRVVTGRESALETLFPNGEFTLAEGLYERSSTMRYVNALSAVAVGAFSAAFPPGRSLRVLEVGAGTGGTTSSLLPALSRDGVVYTFTDVGDTFLDRARERFAGAVDLQVARLDLDRDLDAQGFKPASFDLIVAANAVHACADAPRALARLRTLLAPGGLLALIESTTPFAWFDYTTRLIEGWRAFDDELRTEEPLLNADTWIATLGAAGFQRVDAWPKRGASAETLGQHLLLAQAPGELAAFESVREAPEAQAPRALAEVAAAAAADDMLAAPESERLGLMRAFVREQVVTVLRCDPAQPPGRHSRLTDLGMDSLMAVQLRGRLGRGLALAKPPAASVMFDHPTIEALACHLLAMIAPAADAQVAVAPVAAAEPRSIEAIAGMDDAEIDALLNERNRRRAG